MTKIIVLDSLTEDVFVCGLCKSIFNAIEKFLDHKKVKCIHITNENVFNEFSPVQPVCTLDENIPSAEVIPVPPICTPDVNTLLTDVLSILPVCIPDENTNTSEISSTLPVCTSNQNTLISKIPSILPICNPDGNTVISKISPILPVCNNGENTKMTDVLSILPVSKNNENTSITEVSPALCKPDGNTLDNVPQAESKEESDVSNWLSCTACDKKFKKKRGLQAHMKSHYVKPYQCLVCGRCFIQNSNLTRHIMIHKVWPNSIIESAPKCLETDLLSYSCPYCSSEFSNYFHFLPHLKTHNSMKMFKCIQGDCKSAYDEIEKLLQHVTSAHATQIYVCHICHESFSSLANIANHELLCNDFAGYHNSKQYKCCQCKAVFDKIEKLSAHQLSENHKIVCSHCKKTFANEKRLRLHLHVHKNVKPFQCNLCDRSFPVEKFLFTHMLRHGPKEYTCAICKCVFSRSDILRRHLRSHSKADKMPCPYKDTLNCEEMFSRLDKLNKHLLTHQDSSPTVDDLENGAKDFFQEQVDDISSYDYLMTPRPNSELDNVLSDLNLVDSV